MAAHSKGRKLRMHRHDTKCMWGIATLAQCRPQGIQLAVNTIYATWDRYLELNWLKCAAQRINFASNFSVQSSVCSHQARIWFLALPALSFVMCIALQAHQPVNSDRSSACDPQVRAACGKVYIIARHYLTLVFQLVRQHSIAEISGQHSVRKSPTKKTIRQGETRQRYASRRLTPC